MTHLDEGTILTIRDRGLVDADARDHLDECAECAAALADARERANAVATALRALDGGPRIDVEAAKASVRRRLDQKRETPPVRVPRLYGTLGRAAILVLLASGAVYALPNSPLRGWLQPEERPEAAVEVVPVVQPEASEGIELPVPAGGLTVVLTSVRSGDEVEIVWTDGDRISVVAGADSRYQVSATGLGVDAAPGDVRIEVPSDAEPIIVEVNGRMVLRKVDGELDIQGDVLSRDENGIVFAAGQR